MLSMHTDVKTLYNWKLSNFEKSVCKETIRVLQKRCASPDVEDSRSAWKSMDSLRPTDVNSFSLQW